MNPILAIVMVAGVFCFVWWVGKKMDEADRRYRIKRYRHWDNKHEQD